VLVLQLAEKGQVGLDDTVARWLGSKTRSCTPSWSGWPSASRPTRPSSSRRRSGSGWPPRSRCIPARHWLPLLQHRLRGPRPGGRESDRAAAPGGVRGADRAAARPGADRL
jgi:hypothetical protein